jgi:hypothetical protein
MSEITDDEIEMNESAVLVANSSSLMLFKSSDGIATSITVPSLLVLQATLSSHDANVTAVALLCAFCRVIPLRINVLASTVSSNVSWIAELFMSIVKDCSVGEVVSYVKASTRSNWSSAVLAILLPAKSANDELDSFR